MNTVHKTAHWPAFVCGTVILIALVPLLPPPYSGAQVMTAGVGGLWALAFYLQQRHAEDTKFMRELMTQFNARYDSMNNSLQKAFWKQADFDTEQKLQFIDYFNLCAEEWLFWRKGYIDDSVWHAWKNGMIQYASDPRVRALWVAEARSESYYGFQFPVSSEGLEAK